MCFCEGLGQTQYDPDVTRVLYVSLHLLLLKQRLASTFIRHLVFVCYVNIVELVSLVRLRFTAAHDVW